MRRFERVISVAGKTVKLYFAVYDKDDTYVAMTSGIPYKEPQYLFLDYDEAHEPEEWEWITNEYSLKRAIIVESSPKRYQYLSFSPLCIGIISEIMFHSNADKLHCQHLFRDGFVGIRLSKKKVGKYPKVVKAIVNKKGTNFYDFNREKAFEEVIGKGIDLDTKDVFKGLTNRKEVDANEF